MIVIFALIASVTVFADEPKSTENNINTSVTAKMESKLSEVELKRITDRIEEIRKMDRSDLTVKEKRELRKELRGTKESIKKDGYIYISAGTLLIILLILLLI